MSPYELRGFGALLRDHRHIDAKRIWEGRRQQEDALIHLFGYGILEFRSDRRPAGPTVIRRTLGNTPR